jgi:hypothetical protein
MLSSDEKPKALPLSLARSSFLRLMGLLMLSWVPSFSIAAPDFAQSVITASAEEPVEGDVVRFTVNLKNSGDAPAESAELTIEGPLMGFLIGTGGLNEPAIDPEAQKVSASLSLLPGAEKQIWVDVLTPRDSWGDALTLAVHLAHDDSGAELWDRKTISVDTRLSQSGIPIGGLRIAPVAFVVLAWFILFALAWLGVRLWIGNRARSDRLFGPGAAVTAMMVAVGFWMFFAAMAWRDYRALTSWSETTATIVGQRIVSQSVSNNQRRASGSGTSSGTSESFSPEFALRYTLNGAPFYSTGYDTGSSLRLGGRARREREMKEWTVGAQVPCWYDPADPRDVVVHRGFGGAYFLALLPLPVFWLGLVLLRGSISRSET